MPTTFSENWTHYNVSGATLADVEAAISALPEAGTCSWHPTYSYTTGADGKVDALTMTVTYTIEMPTWTDYSSASPEAQAEWDRWYAALEAHEKGHIEATQWAFNMDDTIVGMDPSEADGQIGKFFYDIQVMSDNYDTETNHGLNYGTVMDSSIP